LIQDEISEMKRKFKIMGHQIEQLKEELSAKDLALVKEHFDHIKVSMTLSLVENYGACGSAGQPWVLAVWDVGRLKIVAAQPWLCKHMALPALHICSIVPGSERASLARVCDAERQGPGTGQGAL
jgi:hypothetical protein